MFKFIGGLIGLVVSIFCATALFWAGIAWEHRPAHWPSYTAHLGPFSHTFEFPESLGAQLAAEKTLEAAAAKRSVAIQTAQAQITVAAAKHDTVVQTKIRTITKTIIQEIPSAITPAVDKRYPLPNSLVRVFDASVLGVDLSAVSNPAGQSDDEASAVTDSEAGAVLAGDIGICRGATQELTDLQDWVSAESAASKK